MELTPKLLDELQKRLKIGNRRGVHLNAIPSSSVYKFDLNRLSHINKALPGEFIKALLTEQPLKFRVSWKNNIADFNSLEKEEQTQLTKITKGFENLINQTEVIESEKGVNTFGFGFPVLIRRDKGDNKLTAAPVLIWSLRIKRTKEFNTWEIQRNEDDPIYLNEILINHLQNDSNISIEKIPREMLDDGLISEEELLKLCVDLIKSVNTIVPENIEKILSDKITNIVSIKDKKYYEDLTAKSNDAIIDFGGLFSIFEVQKQNIIDDYGFLAKNVSNINLKELAPHNFQSISSVETDPSQQSILHSLENSRNIMVQGPPGTGKSQTLTAVLINALENQKKTIVVCEKITALEVLHNALIEKGLSSNCVLIRDIVKDRKNAVDSVRNRIDNSDYRKTEYTYSKAGLDTILKKATELINSINLKHKNLDRKIFGDKSWTELVGLLLAETKNPVADSNLNIDKSEFEFSTLEYNDLLEKICKGQVLYAQFKDFESLSLLNGEKFAGNDIYLAEQTINSSFQVYEKSLKEIKDVESKFSDEYINIRKAALATLIEKIKTIYNEIMALAERQSGTPEFFNEAKTTSVVYKLLTPFSKQKKEIITDQTKIKSLFSQLEFLLLKSVDLEKLKFSSDIKSNLSLLSEKFTTFNTSNGELDNKIRTEYSDIDILDLQPAAYSTETLSKLKKLATELREKIIIDSWFKSITLGKTYKEFINSVENLIKQKLEYFNSADEKTTKEIAWHLFYNSLSGKQQKVINELKQNSDWRKTFVIHYLNLALINAANPELPTNDSELIDLNEILKRIEKEQLKYISEFWHAKQMNAAKDFELRNNELSVENLYNKRSSTKFKRLTLRQIAQYDTDLFTTFFPIILTSPDCCSNLFKGMNNYFDIVMFDEASQLRLEDNLPAILKGKQIIIAGDEHQMPPSSYFSKVFEGSVDDEDELEEDNEIIVNKDNILLSCESLLDFSQELSFDKRYLDFHYRSKHPFLIDFSNHAFYQQRLKPLPHKFDYTPIKYIPVKGTFSEYMNEAEADMVLSILENNIQKLPGGEYPSVGVATFNITQRNLIKSKILDRQKSSEFEEFNNKIQELEKYGFFIKNLENIQGDERDVIILSTTYGTGKDGKFTQRFGPINHSKGYKLLNVIITRAKYKVYVCSSIPEEIFLNYKEHLTAEGANNKRAVFYAYLAYCKAVSENNHEAKISVLNALSENASKNTSINAGITGKNSLYFEEEVYNMLAEIFGKNRLTKQFQFAGFKVDIVFESEKTNVPKIAIECDGAKNHSSREAYLYDKHRQKILESHGFVFHRIWSTNWWRNPKKEFSRLVEFIKSIESEASAKVTDYSKTAEAFNDEIILKNGSDNTEEQTIKPTDSEDLPVNK